MSSLRVMVQRSRGKKQQEEREKNQHFIMTRNNLCKGYATKDVLNGEKISGTWLFLDARWRLPNPIPPPRLLLFYLVFCFLILSDRENFSFCLHSSHPDFLVFHYFPCILECLFPLCLLSSVCECVCGGGGRRSAARSISV